MITKHILHQDVIDDIGYEVTVYAQGPKGKAQRIFCVTSTLPEEDKNWYMNKKVKVGGDVYVLASDRCEDLRSFRGETKDPMKFFELFPEYFL